MDISVVIPLYNEEESLPELFAWIQRVMDANHFIYEVRETTLGVGQRKRYQIPPELRQVPCLVLWF